MKKMLNQMKIPSKLKEMIGKRVSVVKGGMKGYTGTVRKVTENSVSVELNAKQKTVTLPLDYVNTEDQKESRDSRMATPNYSKTPAYYPQGGNEEDNDGW